MFSLFLQNIGTVVTILIIFALVIIVLVILYHQKKKGKSLSCGGDCSHCSGACCPPHITKSNEQQNTNSHQSKH
jgi:preprotein translocase subunit SecG